MAEATLSRDSNSDYHSRKRSEREDMKIASALGSAAVTGLAATVGWLESASNILPLGNERQMFEGVIALTLSTVCIASIAAYGGAILGAAIGSATYHLRELITESTNRRTGYII